MLYMFDLSIAGLNIRIMQDNPILAPNTDKYLCKNTDNHIDITVNLTDELLRKEHDLEKNMGMKLDTDNSEYLAIYRCIAEKIVDFNGFLMHASVVEKDGKAYAFSAPSGTGKSTHARLWRENIDGVHMINDDKPIIRLFDGIPYACGTPWCGKHNLSENRLVPLQAICFLEQSPENAIESRRPEQEISKLIAQVYRPSDARLMLKTLDLIDMALAHLSVYRMRCNMEPDAPILSYSRMSK